MKFRDMFKVRQPGNGNKVQKGFEANSKKRVDIKIIKETESEEGWGPKIPVK